MGFAGSSWCFLGAIVLTLGCGARVHGAGGSSGSGDAEAGSAGTLGTGGATNTDASVTRARRGNSPPGSACVTNGECCTMSCIDGKCSSAPCIGDREACTTSGARCGGDCNMGHCVPLNSVCKTVGNGCTVSYECCSRYCLEGVCRDSSFCVQNGDACSAPNDCCSGICDIPSFASLGRCAPATPAGTYCAGGVAGMVCGGCNDCCSLLCAPDPLTGVKVCQPSSGCHLNGDSCRKTEDCCGAAGTGLPGEGHVTCQLVPGSERGYCRNPTACNPEGNRCYYSNYCGGPSGARNDCCAAVGESGVCELDALGVPRCHGLGTHCRSAGETCASAADCCDRLPCVPGADGWLRCRAPVENQPACVPAALPCTVNADCCVGLTCITAPGSAGGTCEPYARPPDGTTGLAQCTSYPPWSDAGVAPVSCALTGQPCTPSSGCCFGESCTTLGMWSPCAPGQACTCYTPATP